MWQTILRSSRAPFLFAAALLSCQAPAPEAPPLPQAKAQAGSLLYFDLDGDEAVDPYEAQNAILLAEEYHGKPHGSGVEASEWRDYILHLKEEDLVYREEAALLRMMLQFEGENPTSFTVDGDWAVMEGVIGPWTAPQLLRLLHEHPDLKGIRMTFVPGSMDDDTLVRVGRFLHRSGLTTALGPDAEIASGGVDFYLAGRRRLLEGHPRVGVHSWDGEEAEGRSLPREHTDHRMYLEYYEAIGIPEAFYWFTLDAAPAAGVHWMTERELAEFGFQKP